MTDYVLSVDAGIEAGLRISARDGPSLFYPERRELRV